MVQALDGWRLRFNRGETNRGNSVWPNGEGQAVALEDKLTAVEAFYGRRGLPARYQLSEAAHPRDLDAVLADRGYAASEPVCVQVAPLPGVRDTLAGEATVPVTLAEQPDEMWADVLFTAEGRDATATAIRRRTLDLIAPRTVYALARVDGRPAAVGRAVLERGWLGVFSMATLPAFRRRRAARGVLGALAGWGLAQGAGDAYLQVVEANIPAFALYAGAGFRTHHRYHYRERGQA